MITSERLKESFAYNPETGLFTRIKKGNKPIGHVSGVVDTSTGYVRLGIGNKVFHAHRLAVLYMTGNYPEKHIEVDHINRNRSDNRWENLRITDSTGNNMNLSKRKDNTSGHTGISYINNKFWARIQLRRKTINLGYYATLEEAVEARQFAEKQLGFNENHGR